MRAVIVLVAGGFSAFVLALAVLVGGAVGPTATDTTLTAYGQAANQEMCAATGPLHGLPAAEASNAEAIVAVTEELSHENSRAAQIALMTALTESHLANVDGGMGGAYGLFQQTPPAWGTVTQILNPTYATTQFVTHLLAVPGWSSLPPWQAAQAVQRSGAGQPKSPLNPHPGILGGNYETYWTQAGRVLSLVLGSQTGMACGGGPTGGEPGSAGRYGLPADYHIPTTATPQATVAIRYALSKLGDRYIYGAAGPNRFDCSGLTMMAWAAAGVRLEHYTVDQLHEGLQVPASQIEPGDLVLVPGVDPPGPGLPGHVGIYLGDQLVLSAVDPQYGVIVQSWTTFVSGGLDAVIDPLQPGSRQRQ